MQQGGSDARWSHNDTKYGFEITVQNTDGVLDLGFGSTLDQAGNDEAWGVDNLVITEELIFG